MSEKKLNSINGVAVPLSIVAAESAEGAEQSVPKLEAASYNGGPMSVAGWPHPIVFDLEKSQVSGSHPIYRDHNPDRIVGHGESRVEATDGGLALRTSGTLSKRKLEAGDRDVSELVDLAAESFPWQASIGAAPKSATFVAKGKSKTVNGRLIAGPFYHVVGELGEVSVVPRGADSTTSTAIAATESKELTEMSEAIENQEQESETTTTKPVKATRTDALEAIKLQRQRQEEIKSLAINAIERNEAPIDTVEELMDAALADNNISARDFEVQLLRASRPSGRIQSAGSSEGIMGRDRNRIVEAAVMRKLGTSDDQLAADYGDRVIDAMDSDKRFRRGIGLKQLLMVTAQSNGHRDLSFDDIGGLIEGAFSRIHASGLSTIDVSGILSNVANKMVTQAFNNASDLMGPGGEKLQAYSVLGAVNSVSDFKQKTSYSLTGDLTYEVVAPGGEIKHGTLGEVSYANQASTYGKMLGLDRRDIINDDLGALQQSARRLGRGAALKLSDVFWTVFLNNTSFFTAGRNNFAAGSGTAFSIDSLSQAETLFITQTDPDGKPLGLMPSIMLVPPGISATASSVYASTNIVSGNTGKTPAVNPHSGKYRPYTSPYLSNSTYTGNSALKWYLLGDPMDLPVIETVFLNGRQQPTVEQTNADFNQLGIQMRGYHDFGVALQEYRGGVAMKGEA